MSLDPMVGRTIGNYIVRGKLGEGGMGAVYAAEHPSIGKRVAIKVLHGEFAAQPEIVSRFFTEAKAVNDIQHPNIIDVVDFGTMPPPGPGEPPFVYFVMELITGLGLGELIRREAPLPVARTSGIAIQIADALAASHRAGIVHRDLKPDNVMLVERGRERDFVKLLDFGIAKLTGNSARTHRTRTGMVIGTPQYMSPEQCEGRGNVDHRTDIYALGVVLYQLLTGRVPFVGEGFGEILVQQMGMPPLAPAVLNPQIPPPVELIVLKALEKRPENRYQGMDELIAALEDPAAYVESRGGVAGFLPSPILRDPSRSGVGVAVVALTPVAHPGAPTTLGGAAAQVAVKTPAARRGRVALGAGLLLAVVGSAGSLAWWRSRGAPPALSAGAEVQASGVAAAARLPSPPPSPPAAPPAPETPAPGAVVLPGAVVTPEPAAPAAVVAAIPAAPAVDRKVIDVAIDSTPRGAAVFVDGVQRGLTPYRGELERGDPPVEIKIVLAGYEPLTKRIGRGADLALAVSLNRRRPSVQRDTGGVRANNPDDTKNPFELIDKKGSP